MIKTSRMAIAVLLSGAAIATGVGCGSSSASASSGGAEYPAEVRHAFISTCTDTAVADDLRTKYNLAGGGAATDGTMDDGTDTTDSGDTPG